MRRDGIAADECVLDACFVEQTGQIFDVLRRGSTVYSGTAGMPGQYSVDGPALAVADHFVVAAIKENALRRAGDVARIGRHRCASFRTRHHSGRWCDPFADDSLDRLLIWRDGRKVLWVATLTF